MPSERSGHPRGPVREYLIAFGVAAVYVATLPAGEPCIVGVTRDLARTRFAIRRSWHWAVEITLAPGQQTGWHMHPVPLFGYILEGELTVDYGTKGARTYRAGDGFMEAIDEAHNGRNTGQGPVKFWQC